MAAAETAPNLMLAAALDYARRSLPVFPCKNRDKRPLAAHWVEDATANPDAITWWWTIRWPNANIAIPCGPDFFVVDIDGELGEQSLDALVEAHGLLPPTLTALTGGDGQHFVFSGAGDLGNSASKLGPGIDTRGTGGYIIAPPSTHPSGQRYEWLDPDAPIAPLPDWIRAALTFEPAAPAPTPARVAPPSDSTGITAYARKALDGQAADVASTGEGGRNHRLNQAAFRMGHLVAGGQIDEATVEHELTNAARRCGLTEKEIGPTFTSGLSDGKLEPEYPDPKFATKTRSAPSNEEPKRALSLVGDDQRKHQGQVDEPPPDEPPSPPRRDEEPTDDDPEGEINETDLGNARRLIRRHGHELRYAAHMRAWLRWDGLRWAVDEDAYVDRCTHATAQSIVAEIVTLSDPEKQKKRFAHAIKSEAARAVENAMRMASTLSGVRVGAHELDADPWALNVLNGTIDLRTGELRAHDPADLITKLAPVTYDANAHDGRWDAYLQSALRDDDLAGWLQRAVGYTLTGDTSEELLFFVHGPARAGKSTFLEAVKAALGDYSRSAEWETFLDRDHGGGARPDIARLAGARLVTSNEVDEGRKLAEGLVKTLTGGDTITARFLYRDEFEYLPQFKLWLAANHKPKVRHGDDAIWRRIRLVPFLHPPEHVDLELKHHLVNDPAARSAILAWAVRGCSSWQAEGLAAVDAVRNATESYRNEMDPLGEFLADHCAFGTADDYWVTAKELRKSYEEWATEQGLKRTLSPPAFREALEERGCTSDRTRIEHKPTRIWRGLRMLLVNEEPEKLPGIAVADVTNDESATRATRATGVPERSPMRGRTGGDSPEQASRTSRASRAENDTDTSINCSNCGQPHLVPRSLLALTNEPPLCSDCEPF